MSDWAQPTEEQDEELERIARRLGIDTSAARRNGDRVTLAILEKLIGLEQAFCKHLAREERLYAAALLMGGGGVISSLPSLFPAFNRALEVVFRITLVDGPIAWPTEVLELIGGLMMLSGVLAAFSPHICAMVIGRMLRSGK